jgi:hypothetical protein
VVVARAVDISRLGALAESLDPHPADASGAPVAAGTDGRPATIRVAGVGETPWAFGTVGLLVATAATILTLALRRRRRASRLADRVRARLARQIPGPGDGSSATAPS